MKNSLILICILIFPFFMGSCKKDNPSEQPQVDSNNKMELRINGVTYSFGFSVLLQDEIFNSYNTNTKLLSFARLEANGNPHGIYITVRNFDLKSTPLPVTLKYTGNMNDLSVIYNDSDNESFGMNVNNPNDFTLTITAYENKVLKGTFEGTLYSANTNKPTAVFTSCSLDIHLEEY